MVVMMMVAVVVRLTKGSARYENNDGYERQVKYQTRILLKEVENVAISMYSKGYFQLNT